MGGGAAGAGGVASGGGPALCTAGPHAGRLAGDCGGGESRAIGTRGVVSAVGLGTGAFISCVPSASAAFSAWAARRVPDPGTMTVALSRRMIVALSGRPTIVASPPASTAGVMKVRGLSSCDASRARASASRR